MPFDIAIRETEPEPQTQKRLDERHADSVFARIADLVPARRADAPATARAARTSPSS